MGSFAQPSVHKQDPGLVAGTKQKWLQWFLLRWSIADLEGTLRAFASCR